MPLIPHQPYRPEQVAELDTGELNLLYAHVLAREAALRTPEYRAAADQVHAEMTRRRPTRHPSHLGDTR